MKRWLLYIILILTSIFCIQSANAGVVNKKDAQELRGKNDTSRVLTWDKAESLKVYLGTTGWVIDGGDTAAVISCKYLQLSDGAGNYTVWFRNNSGTAQWSDDSGANWDDFGTGTGGAADDSLISWKELYNKIFENNPDFDTTIVGSDTDLVITHSDRADTLGTTVYTITSGGMTSILSSSDSTRFGPEGLTVSDSLLARKLYLLAGVDTFYVGRSTVADGERCLYYVTTAVGPDSVYWGACTGGAGVSQVDFDKVCDDSTALIKAKDSVAAWDNGALDSSNLKAGSVAESDLLIDGAPTDEYALTWEASSGTDGQMKWEAQAGGSGLSYTTETDSGTWSVFAPVSPNTGIKLSGTTIIGDAGLTEADSIHVYGRIYFDPLRPIDSATWDSMVQLTGRYAPGSGTTDGQNADSIQNTPVSANRPADGAIFVAAISGDTTLVPVVLSGDATMANTGAVTVADDSHAHTTTTISGLLDADMSNDALDPDKIVGDAVDNDLLDSVLAAQRAEVADAVTDADKGDVTISSGAWAVEDDSHAHSTYQPVGHGDADSIRNIRVTEMALTNGYVLTCMDSTGALGDSIIYKLVDSSNVADAKLAEADLLIDGAPTDEYCLTWEASSGIGGQMKWEAQAGGGGESLWDSIGASQASIVHMNGADTAIEIRDSGVYTIIRPGSNTTLILGDSGQAHITDLKLGINDGTDKSWTIPNTKGTASQLRRMDDGGTAVEEWFTPAWLTAVPDSFVGAGETAADVDTNGTKIDVALGTRMPKIGGAFTGDVAGKFYDSDTTKADSILITDKRLEDSLAGRADDYATAAQANATHTGAVTGATVTTITNDSVTSARILDQTIVKGDIDTTASNIPFASAYHITTATADSAYVTANTINDSLNLALRLAGGTMTGNIAFSAAQTVDGKDVSTLQDGDATLTDIADGTIAENLVNTANPWAVNEGGTGAATFTDGGVLIGNGTGGIVALPVMTNGQLLIGDGTTDPAVCTLYKATNSGMRIVNGAGTITFGMDTAKTDGTFGGTTYSSADFAVVNGVCYVKTDGIDANQIAGETGTGSPVFSASPTFTTGIVVDSGRVYGTNHFRFVVSNPYSQFATDSNVCIVPLTDYALKVKSYTITLNADPATEVDFKLRYADAFIGKANAVTIDDDITVAGKLTVGTSGLTTSAVPAGKCIYLLWDVRPISGIKNFNMDITYTYD